MNSPGQMQENVLQALASEASCHLRGRPVGDHTSVGEKDHPITESLDFGHVMTGDQKGRAFLIRQLQQSLSDTQRYLGIERGRGLVQDSSQGPVQGGFDDPHERPLTRRKLGAQRGGEVADPESFEGVVDLRRRLGQAGRGPRTCEGTPAPASSRPKGDSRRRIPPGPGHGWTQWGSRCPTKSMVPSSGVTTPRSMNSVVVLPAPFGPSKATRSPVWTSRLTPATAISPRNRFTKPRARRTASTRTTMTGRGLPPRWRPSRTPKLPSG